MQNFTTLEPDPKHWVPVRTYVHTCLKAWGILREFDWMLLVVCSCCLRHEQKPALQQILNAAAENNNVLFVSVSDHYELCLGKGERVPIFLP